MMERTEHKEAKKGFWNLIDNIEGDKVVWIIVFMLIMISVLAIFSSTPLLALEQKTDRISIIKEQSLIVLFGLGLIYIVYNIKKIGILRRLSKAGFAISFILLLLLDTHIDLGFIKAQDLNQAWRTLAVFGFQLHVFEVVKVAMIMYLAWAIHAYKTDQKDGRNSKSLKMANSLAKRYKSLAFLAKPVWKRIMYFYFPIILTTAMVLPGSNSSAMIVGGIMLATLLVGGIGTKEIGLAFAGVLIVFALAFTIYKASGGTVLKRLEHLETRLTRNNNPIQLLDEELIKDKKAWNTKKDDLLQPNAAKIAVHEGGLLGKGPGGSTQKYVVPVIFGDYMFSFLLEEYGLWGGILVIILYVSLLARGSMIARLCDNEFAKTAVGGLTLLITGQAFMHMFICVDLGPLTGQTLPLVSHGNSSFLMFCIAFGIILSISRMARNKIREEEEAAEPIYESEKDDIQASLDVLDQLDSRMSEMQQ